MWKRVILAVSFCLLLSGCGQADMVSFTIVTRQERGAEDAVPAEESANWPVPLDETTEILPGDYDFDHDGQPEAVEIVTVLEPEARTGQPAWYEVRVKRQDGSLIWAQQAHWAHVGWTSIFALAIDEEEYLLRYNPYMGQGAATYRYEIFSLNETGEEVLFRENSVDFDVNFGGPIHLSFDAGAIAAFLKEVHSYLDESALLLTTESGQFQAGGSGADFWLDDFTGGLLRESTDWDAVLQEFAAEKTEEWNRLNG